MKKKDRIFVAGGTKVIGAAILRALMRNGYTNLVGVADAEPDWTDQKQVTEFFARERPEYVFIAGGKSGGISYNRTHPADLIYDNLAMETNIIPAAHAHGVAKLMYLASSCCYPKECPQPMREEYLMTGPLEPTNEAYATAKLAGIALCRAYRSQYGCDFITAIPSNYFGPGDDFSPENSHVIGALIRRMHEAAQSNSSSIEIWGTGAPRREFIYVDDLAEASLAAMRHYSGDAPINLGSGGDWSIAELAEMIRTITGFKGELRFDASKPDGMLVKILESSKLQDLGWKPAFAFENALERTYLWFLGTLTQGTIPDES